MADDILHTGRADIHHPKGPLTARANERWVYDYLRRVGAHDEPRWDVAACDVVARVRAAVAEDLAQLVESLCPARDSAHLGDHCDFRLAAAAIRGHAAAPSVRPDTDRTPDVGTPEGIEKIRAPWTVEQVNALNRYQQAGWMHPFTCGGEHEGGRPVLVAQPSGWLCPDPRCGYSQDWAHAWMTEPVGSVPSLPEETPDA